MNTFLLATIVFGLACILVFCLYKHIMNTFNRKVEVIDRPMKAYNVVHKIDKTYSQEMSATSLKDLQSSLKKGYIAQEIQ